MQKWLILFVLATIVFLIDQIAKAWVVAQMVIGQTIEISPILVPYLQITRTTNTGIAFGFFNGGNSFLLVVTSIVVVVLLYIYRTLPIDARLQQVGYAIIIGAALGNIIDRIRYGHVVDFVHITIPNLISNVSNFADHFVIIGVVIILLDSFINEPQKKHRPPESENVTLDVLDSETSSTD